MRGPIIRKLVKPAHFRQNAWVAGSSPVTLFPEMPFDKVVVAVEVFLRNASYKVVEALEGFVRIASDKVVEPLAGLVRNAASKLVEAAEDLLRISR